MKGEWFLQDPDPVDGCEAVEEDIDAGPPGLDEFAMDLFVDSKQFGP